MLVDDSCQLCFGVKNGVRGGEAVAYKISRQAANYFLIALLEWSGMSNQNRLVILGSPRENGGNECDTNASTLVSEEIGKA